MPVARRQTLEESHPLVTLVLIVFVQAYGRHVLMYTYHGVSSLACRRCGSGPFPRLDPSLLRQRTRRV